VVDGKVLVASYKQLAIFGLGATGKVEIANPMGLKFKTVKIRKIVHPKR